MFTGVCGVHQEKKVYAHALNHHDHNYLHVKRHASSNLILPYSSIQQHSEYLIKGVPQ